MSYTKTPIDNIDVPDNKEYLKDAWRFSGKVATGLEPYTVMRFASMTDLTTKLTGVYVPTAGMVAYVVADASFYGYTGGAWKRIYPVEKQILSGTAVPASALGAVGDLYFQV